jgi:hypothetical protein
MFVAGYEARLMVKNAKADLDMTEYGDKRFGFSDPCAVGVFIQCWITLRFVHLLLLPAELR